MFSWVDFSGQCSFGHKVRETYKTSDVLQSDVGPESI